MNTSDYYDPANAPIQCPLKNSVIAWARCIKYRKKHNCLCPAAIQRIRLKDEGHEVFQQKLNAIKVPCPDRPPGWTVQKQSRFYVIYDASNQIVHRATNQSECENYLKLAATAQSLQIENNQLWQLLKNELTKPKDPWDELDQRLAANTNAPDQETGPDQ